uniref:Microtubule associated protein 10 n=1 Tax=Fundulus heteroclitus TaxID=8078 RepID=A0A146PAN7_FUNHE
MMSEDAPETLFSFELLVDHIRLQTNHKAPDRLAVGLRFLDFPTLLIYQHPSERLSSHREPALNQRDFSFHRGKSCFFKMNPGSLRVRLSAAPLHAMVLDVTEETSPRFLGSSLLSLAEAMGRIKLLSGPSAHTGKGVVAVSGLSGEMIGTASLSYRLVCLGASLLPHITEGSGYEGTTGPGGPEDQERSKEKNKPGSMCSPTGSESRCSLRGGDPGDPKIRLDESEEDDGAESQTEDDLTAFCPPHLYYSNTTPSHNGNTEQDYRLSNLDAEGRTFEDSPSAWEEGKRKVSGFKAARREMTHATETSGSRETDVLRGALRRLPLLNALVAELSQLSVRPDPAQNTGPSSSDHRDPRRAESLEEDLDLTDGHLYRLSPPRNCSTPLVDPAEVKHAPKETPSARKPQRKKLEYGTTKTYRLRLEQISPVKANSRECKALTASDARSRSAKETEKSRAGGVKSKKRGFLLNQRPNLDDNTGTRMQSDAALRGTVTLRPATQQGPQTELQGRPVKHGHHGASDQPDPQSDGYQSTDPLPELPERRSSRSSSPDSLFSQGSRTADDANYADDFDSLESSSTSSPNPDRSPEPLGAKAPKSPVSPCSYISDSRSEGFQKKSVDHAPPVQAMKSPHRALTVTRVIPPHTHSSAQSDDEERPRSSQTVCSRKQADASGQTEQISSAESVLTSRSEKEESPRSRSLLRGFSAESMSSVEELEDELGSLDFRKEYKHISELVASKLPGYTM